MKELFQNKIGDQVETVMKEEEELRKAAKVKKILEMKPNKRNEAETNLLIEILKSIQFFKDRNLSEQDMLDLSKSLGHSNLNTDEYVM